jgi:hypothetical protein
MALKNKKAAKKAVKRTVKKALKKRPTTKKRAAKPRPALKKKTVLKKRPSSKKRQVAKKIVKKQEGKLIGLITHYFPHVQAAVIKLKAPLSIGETIKIKGHTTDLTQTITSMQMDRVNISNAKKGMEIGVQVSARVRHGDKVYKN